MTSKIEWTDFTWNPISGCTKISTGCQFCYAEKIAKRMRGRYGYPQDDPFKVTLHPARLYHPLKWKRPRRIFVNSMSDLFHKDVPTDFILNIFEVMHRASQHRFVILTKRPERIESVLYGKNGKWYMAYGDFLRNVAIGVSVENQEKVDERLPWLMDCGWQGTKIISAEPLLEPINILDYPDLDWVVGGCEAVNGRLGRPTPPGAFEFLKDQCLEMDVPFFLKQMDVAGALAKMPRLDGKIWDQQARRKK